MVSSVPPGVEEDLNDTPPSFPLNSLFQAPACPCLGLPPQTYLPALLLPSSLFLLAGSIISLPPPVFPCPTLPHYLFGTGEGHGGTTPFKDHLRELVPHHLPQHPMPCTLTPVTPPACSGTFYGWEWDGTPLPPSPPPSSCAYSNVGCSDRCPHHHFPKVLWALLWPSHTRALLSSLFSSYSRQLDQGWADEAGADRQMGGGEVVWRDRCCCASSMAWAVADTQHGPQPATCHLPWRSPHGSLLCLPARSSPFLLYTCLLHSAYLPWKTFDRSWII